MCPLCLGFAMVTTYAYGHGAGDALAAKRIFRNEDIFLCYLASFGLARSMRRDENMTGKGSLVAPNEFAEPSQVLNF
jgi:hypothetical protein